MSVKVKGAHIPKVQAASAIGALRRFERKAAMSPLAAAVAAKASKVPAPTYATSETVKTIKPALQKTEAKAQAEPTPPPVVTKPAEPPKVEAPVQSQSFTRKEQLRLKYADAVIERQARYQAADSEQEGIRRVYAVYAGNVRPFNEGEKATWLAERRANERAYHDAQLSNQIYVTKSARFPLFEIVKGKKKFVKMSSTHRLIESSPALACWEQANMKEGHGFRPFKGETKTVYITRRAHTNVSKLDIPLDWYEVVPVQVMADQAGATARHEAEHMMMNLESAQAKGKIEKTKSMPVAKPRGKLALVPPTTASREQQEPAYKMPVVEAEPPWTQEQEPAAIVQQAEAPALDAGDRKKVFYQRLAYRKAFIAEQKQQAHEECCQARLSGAVQNWLRRKDEACPPHPKAQEEAYEAWFAQSSERPLILGGPQERLTSEEIDTIAYEAYWTTGQRGLDGWFFARMPRESRPMTKLEKLRQEMPEYENYATPIPNDRAMVPVGEAKFIWTQYPDTEQANRKKIMKAGSSVGNVRVGRPNLSGGVGVESSSQVRKAAALNDWGDSGFAGFIKTPLERATLRGMQKASRRQWRKVFERVTYRSQKEALVRAYMNAKPKPVYTPPKPVALEGEWLPRFKSKLIEGIRGFHISFRPDDYLTQPNFVMDF